MKNKLLVLALSCATVLAQDDLRDTPRTASLRTIVPLAVTTLLIGTSHTQSHSCLEYWGETLAQDLVTHPVVTEIPLNVSQVVNASGKLTLGVTQEYRNCTFIHLGPYSNPTLAICCSPLVKVASFLKRSVEICVGSFVAACSVTTSPTEIACMQGGLGFRCPTSPTP